MLGKANRLSKTKDVKQAMRGRSYFSPRFVIKYFQKRFSVDGGSLVRATVVVSTKVSKRATKRNMIKRRIREVVRKSLAQLKPGDYAIIVKPQVMTLAPGQIAFEFAHFLRQSKLIV